MLPTLEEIVEQTRQNRKLIIADDYELCLQRVSSSTDRFTNGKQVAHGCDQNWWMGLRLLHRKRPGRSAGYFSGPESLALLIECAFESAKRSSPDPWFRFPLWKTLRIRKSVQSGDFHGEDGRSFYDHIPRAFENNFRLEEIYEHSQNSVLLHRKSEKSLLQSERLVQSARFALSCPELDIPPFVQERASSQSEDQKVGWLRTFLESACVSPEFEIHEGPERCPIILGPMAGSEMLKQMSEWFTADNAQAGRSPLSGCTGQPLFSELISIIDDGTLEGGLSTAPFDLEGCRTQRTVLVDKGVLKDFLHDSYTATRENRVSTGNSIRRPHCTSTSIGPTNLYLAPSDLPAVLLVESLESGIYINSLERRPRLPGSATSEIWLKGSGWRIRHGQKQSAIRGISLRIDLNDWLSKAVMVGDDLEFFGGVGAPSILFDQVTLGF